MRQITRLAVALSAVLPGLAFAWTPYAPGAAEPMPYYGYPGHQGRSVPPAAWPTQPSYEANWPAPPFARGNDWGAPPAERLPAQARPAWPRLSLSRQASEDAYLIDIQLQNIDPAQLDIRPAGRGLVIGYGASAQVDQRDTLPSGEGYQRRYSFSRGTTSRRVGLPPDADLAAMTREVKDGHVLIRVPRRADASWGGGRW